MNVRKTEKPDLLIIQIEGKFDIEQSQSFEKTFTGWIGNQPKRIGMDLRELNFVDSSGMGSLIKCLNRVRNYGGEMILYGLKPALLNVFKLAKLDNFFTVLSPQEFEEKYLSE